VAFALKITSSVRLSEAVTMIRTLLRDINAGGYLDPGVGIGIYMDVRSWQVRLSIRPKPVLELLGRPMGPPPRRILINGY